MITESEYRLLVQRIRQVGRHVKEGIRKHLHSSGPWYSFEEDLDESGVLFTFTTAGDDRWALRVPLVVLLGPNSGLADEVQGLVADQKAADDAEDKRDETKRAEEKEKEERRQYKVLKDKYGNEAL